MTAAGNGSHSIKTLPCQTRLPAPYQIQPRLPYRTSASLAKPSLSKPDPTELCHPMACLTSHA